MKKLIITSLLFLSTSTVFANVTTIPHADVEIQANITLEQDPDKFEVFHCEIWAC